jgi:cytoskeletal protein CcmA (bactofilin family)
MAFGMSKPTTDHRDPSDLPGDWVAWLESGVEVEGNIKVATGSIRVNAHLKGDIVGGGAAVVHKQGEVEGNIECRVASSTGKVRGTVHATERLEIKAHGSVLVDLYTSCLRVDSEGFFDGQCPMPEPATQPPDGADSQEHP